VSDISYRIFYIDEDEPEMECEAPDLLNIECEKQATHRLERRGGMPDESIYLCSAHKEQAKQEGIAL
jgi:hypothetical protein